MTYDDFLKEWRDSSADIEVPTSGSTGKPKLIRLPKSVCVESARRTNAFFGINAASRIHSCISPDFIGGKMVAVRAIVADCQFTFETPSNEPKIPFDGRVVDLVSVVASQMVYIIDHPDDFRHVRRYLIGGGALPYMMGDDIVNKGLDAWESYGMTETASHIALRRVQSEPGPFYPLPGIGISQNDEGCLVISGVRDEDVVTNDIVRIYPDGGFEVVGRKDNVIISGGRKIHPEEVEAKIRRLIPDLGEFIVTGIPDAKWGQALELVIVRKSMTPKEARAILQLLRDGLEGWQTPKSISVVDSLPHTPNGKLRRNP